MIIIILFVASSSFVLQPVHAQEDTNGTDGTIADQAIILNSDWLSASIVSFNGQPLDYTGKLGRLNLDVGGYGMKDFVNHGEIAYDKESETRIYMAEMNFIVSDVLYTDCMIDDVYPDRGESRTSKEWLELTTMQHWMNGYRPLWGDIDNDKYSIEYNRISTGVIDSHEYDGPVRMQLIISPDLPIKDGDTIEIQGSTFLVPDIRIFIENVEMIERTYGVCDDPINLYSETEGIIHIRKEDISSTSISQGKSAAEGQCGDGLEKTYPDTMPYAGKTTAEDEIDWAGVKNREIIYGVTHTSGSMGQSFASSPTIGSVWSRTDDYNDADDIFEFDTHIRIKPNIFYDMERFDLRHTYLYVDRYKEVIFPDYGLCDIKNEYVDTITRIVGLGVQNIFIKMKYQVKVTMLLAVQPTSEEGENILEDPEIMQGDIIWDNTIGGTTDAKATVVQPRGWNTDIEDWFTGIGDWLDDMIDGLDEWWDDLLSDIFSDWFEQYWWIILLGIIIVVIVVGFFLFYPRLAKGTARAYGEYKEQKSQKPREPRTKEL